MHGSNPVLSIDQQPFISIASNAYAIDRNLSKAQQCFIGGPLLASPIKFLFGVAEVVSGVAMAVISGLLAVVFSPCATCRNFFAHYACEGTELAISGCFSIIYSAVNIGTFGMFGLFFEYFVEKYKLE